MSVIVPVRNEAPFIEENVTALLNQTYPRGLVEILVIDGLSTDTTPEIAERLSELNPQVRFFQNPAQIVAAAFNIGIRSARGEVVLIVGGHTVVAKDYIAQNVTLLRDHPEVVGVGGPVQPMARTVFGRAVSVAMSHRLGIGNATHRHPNFEGYAFGSAFPAFRRSLFDKIGLYDENFVRNQDDELLLRAQIAGLKNFISPVVKSFYYVRETPRQLFLQYFQYGFWRVPVLLKHRRPASIRQLAPILFFGIVILGFLLGSLSSFFAIMSLCAMAVYLLALGFAALIEVPRVGGAVALRVPAAMIILHSAYAMGMLKAIWQRLMRGSHFYAADSARSALSR